MSATIETINCAFADAVHKQFLQKRYGVQSCPAPDQILQAHVNKELADFKTLGGTLTCCDINDIVSD
jgi:hypothetical protein